MQVLASAVEKAEPTHEKSSVDPDVNWSTDASLPAGEESLFAARD
jgi:hypothetical protein